MTGQSKLSKRQLTHLKLLLAIPKSPRNETTIHHLEVTIKQTLREHEKREEWRNTLRVFTLTTSAAAGGYIVQQSGCSQIVLLLLVLLFLGFMDMMDTFHFDMAERQVEFNERLIALLLQLQAKPTRTLNYLALRTIFKGMDKSNMGHKIKSQ